MRSARTLAGLMFVLLLVSMAAAQRPATVDLAAESYVTGEMVELGSVAKISGPAELTQRLSTISLGYAPGIGSSRDILTAQVRLAIKAAGIDDSMVFISAVPKAVVRRASQAVSNERLENAVRSVVDEALAGSGTEFVVKRLDVTGPIHVPVGSVDIRASFAGARNLFERIPVPIEIRVDGRLFRTLTATVELEVYGQVLLAAIDVLPGKRISPDEFRLERIRLERPLISYVRDAAAIKAVQATRPILAGRPLTTDSIVPFTVIKLGDPVRIEAQNGRIKIMVDGEARGNGRIGDRISVKNRQSGVIMQAIVVDQGIVKVFI